MESQPNGTAFLNFHILDMVETSQFRHRTKIYIHKMITISTLHNVSVCCKTPVWMRIAYFIPVIHAQILASKRNETELLTFFQQLGINSNIRLYEHWEQSAQVFTTPLTGIKTTYVSKYLRLKNRSTVQKSRCHHSLTPSNKHKK